MQEKTERQKLIRILIIFSFAAVVLMAILFAISRATNNQAGHETLYHDKYSGETVSTINGKSPETYNTSSGPIYLGFSKLLEHGYTQTQLTNIQTAYQQYFDQSKQKVSEVSLDVSTYKNVGPAADNPQASISSYTVVFNRKNMYKTELESSTLDDITVRIYDLSGKPVFSYSSYPQDSDPTCTTAAADC